MSADKDLNKTFALEVVEHRSDAWVDEASSAASLTISVYVIWHHIYQHLHFSLVNKKFVVRFTVFQLSN